MSAQLQPLEDRAIGRIRLDGSSGLRAPAARIAGLPGPRAPWLIGHALAYRRDGLHTCLERWSEQYGPIYRARLGRVDAVIVADDALVMEVMRRRPDVFARGRRVSEIIDETMPTGLFTAEGEQWRRQRRLVMRALTPEQIKRFFPILRTVTQRLDGRWRTMAASGEPCDIARDFKRYAVDVATWLAMGEDINTLEHPESGLQADVESWFALIGRRTIAPLPYWRWFKPAADRAAEAALERLRELAARFIARTRARFDEHPELRAHPQNIVQALVAARDEPGSEFTDDDVTGNVMTMLFAGEDTAANTMSWLTFLLTQHADARERAADEARRALDGDTVIASFDALERLSHLEAATMEAMRLKPVGPLLGFTALRDVDLAGVHVPAGAVVMLLLREASRRSGGFAQGERFEPARWLEPQARDADDPKRKTWPFGGGPRYCPGRYLAMVEIKLALSTLLANYEVSLVGDASSVGERLAFTLAPSPFAVRLTAR